MSKIALVTDSACDLTDEELKGCGARLLPLRIIYTDREYRDRVEIHPDEVYANLEKEVPKTSLPSGEDIEALYSELMAEGYTHVLGVFISSGLSGTANAVKMYAEEHPSMVTHVFDTKNLSMAEGITVLEAGRLIESGMAIEDILEKLAAFQETIDTYYYVDTLEYLMKGGRIGKVAGTIGQLLNLKPIISVNRDGIYYTIAKAKGRKQALLRLVGILEENLEKYKCNVYVMHGAALEEGKALVDTIMKMKNVQSMDLRQISPALGVHTGKGLLGICLQRNPL